MQIQTRPRGLAARLRGAIARSHLLIATLMLGLIGPCLGHAQDSPRVHATGGRGQEVPLSDYERDEVHGATEGGDLDQYLFYRDRPHGLTFDVNINRVFNRGTQADWDEVLVGPVIFRMAVYDVDRNGEPYPEEDRVYINNRPLTRRCTNDPFLDGSNNGWSLFEAEIPIEWFKDGTIKTASPPREPGQPPTPGRNTIRVDIDTRHPRNAWAVEVDWGAFYIRGVRPILFVHGMNDGPGSWEWMREQMPGGLTGASEIDGRTPIAQNAPVVRHFIDRVKREYGVDEVNVVGHSRGGLDSYEAAYRDGAGIENLISIGSPLQGSHVADAVRQAEPNDWQIRYLVTLLGLRDLIADLSTQGRMNYYAARGGGLPVPGVSHYAIVGTRYPANEHSPRWNRGVARRLRDKAFPQSPFTLEQDGLVQRDRAYHPFGAENLAGPWGHHEADTASGGREETAQPYNPGIAEAIWEQCRATAQSGQFSPRRSRGTQGCPPMTVTSLTVTASGVTEGVVSPMQYGSYGPGELLTSTFQIDPSVTSASFVLSADVGSLLSDIVLEFPGGQTYHPNDPIPNGSFETEVLGDQVLVVYSLDSLSPGVYKVHALSAASGSLMAVGFYQSNLGIRPSISAHEMTAGDSVTVAASVDWPGGAQPEGAILEARTRRDDGSFISATPMTWTGTRYEGVFSPVVPGTYTVEVVAIAPGFERAGMSALRVLPTGATIGTPMQSTGRDLNGNTLFDKLEVTVPIDVSQPGSYRLSADLETEDGTFLGGAEATVEATSAGRYSMLLSYDGRTIRNTGIDGPYRVVRAVLMDESPGVFLQVDRVEVVGSTPDYQARQFEGDLLALGTGVSDFGVDTNGNGQYDWLRVLVPVQVETQAAGWYEFNAEIADVQGRRFLYSQAGGASLSSGSNVITLDFRGTAIASALADGPYHIVNLYLYSTNGQHSLSASEVHVTQPYRYFQFEGAPIVIDSVTFDPNPAEGGRAVQATVRLVGRSLQGQTYALSGPTAQIQSMPRTLAIGSGQASAGFTIRTRPVTRRTEVPIRFTRGSEVFVATLVLQPAEVRVASISFAPVELRSGQSTRLTVRLDRAPSANVTVRLQQDAPILDLPSTMVIPAGTREATLRIPARPVHQQRRALVTATVGTSSKTARVLVNP